MAKEKEKKESTLRGAIWKEEQAKKRAAEQAKEEK